MRSRHPSVVIRHRPQEVYDLASDPARLPEWAAGLAAGTAVTGDDELVVDSPMGRVRVRFVARNKLGVLDHEVTLPDGSVTYNPLRVIPHPDGAEVVFTIRQHGLTDEEFERDLGMVEADLARLKRLLEGASEHVETGPGAAGNDPLGRAEIRIADPSDAHSVAQLLHDFNTEFDCPGPDPAEGAPRWRRLLAGTEVFVVVARHGTEGSDVGFAFLTLRPTPYWDGPLAQLEEFYVHPECRSHGIGTALLDRAVDEVRSRGTREMHINVDSDDVGARRFYNRHGFTDIDPDTGSGMRCYLRQL